MSRPGLSLITQALRFLVRPFGYLAFVLALASLSAAAKLLGDKDELGFFSDRLAAMLWRYPEVTRKGVQTAWVVWAVAFLIALPPLGPAVYPVGRDCAWGSCDGRPLAPDVRRAPSRALRFSSACSSPTSAGSSSRIAAARRYSAK